MINCELYFRYLFIRNYFYLTIFNTFYLIIYFITNFVIKLTNSPFRDNDSNKFFRILFCDCIAISFAMQPQMWLSFRRAESAGNWRDRDGESSFSYFIWGASTGVRVTSTKLISRRSWLSRNSVRDLSRYSKLHQYFRSGWVKSSFHDLVFNSNKIIDT